MGIDYGNYLNREVYICAPDSDIEELTKGRISAIVESCKEDLAYLLFDTDTEQYRVYLNEILQFFLPEDLDDADKEFTYVIIRYGKTSRSKEHRYFTYDDDIQVGDKVLVWQNYLYVGNVIRIEKCTQSTAPYPIRKTWLIEKKIYDRIDFKQFDHDNLIKADNLYKDHYLNSDNDHKQYIAKVIYRYEWLRDDYFKDLSSMNITTASNILGEVDYNLDWEWCESNQVDVFYRTLAVCAYMVKNNTYHKYTFDKYICMSVLYKAGKLDEFMLDPEFDKPEIDKDVKLVDEYLSTGECKEKTVSENIIPLMKCLDEYWNAYSDPRIKGEHPQCIEIQEMLITQFNKLSDEEILEFCKSVDADKLEQIAYPLEEVSSKYPCVEPFIKY